MDNTVSLAQERAKQPEKANVTKPLEEYPPVLQARHIRDILGISESKAYEVLKSRKCPTIRLGKRMVVMRDSFIKFLYDSEGASIIDDSTDNNTLVFLRIAHFPLVFIHFHRGIRISIQSRGQQTAKFRANLRKKSTAHRWKPCVWCCLAITSTPRTRYVCYNKTRHKQHCDGQTGYTVSKLDRIIDELVRGLFARLCDLPKDAIIEKRYAQRIAECKKALTHARAAVQAHTAEVMEYKAEVIKVIRGESTLNADLLNNLYEESKVKAEAAEQRVRECEEGLRDSEQTKADLAGQFVNIQNWAELYETCDMATRKMIVSRLFKEIRVKEGYQVDIDLTASCEQLGLLADDVAGDEALEAKSA